MEKTNKTIEEFFAGYAARFNRSLRDPPEVDIDGVVDSFASFFVGASPAGVSGGKNDEQFRAMFPQGFDFYRSIGTKLMKIAAMDITPLDEYHAMVKVHWDSHYVKKDSKEVQIKFDVFYFLQLLDEKPKIFAYVTGDEQKAFQERGLIPD